MPPQLWLVCLKARGNTDLQHVPGTMTETYIDSVGMGTRDFLPRQLADALTGGDDTETTPGTGTGTGTGTTAAGGKTQSDPTNFHLTTGLAAICLFYTLGLALFFHLYRWWSAYPPPPPNEDPDPEDEYDDEIIDEKGRVKKKSWWRRRGQKLNGVKRFGYRVSRGFTILNVCLLAGVMFGSIMLASSSGFGNGTARKYPLSSLPLPVNQGSFTEAV